MTERPWKARHPFAPGQAVTCISNDGHASLAVGRSYTVRMIGCDDDRGLWVAVMGLHLAYPASLFTVAVAEAPAPVEG